MSVSLTFIITYDDVHKHKVSCLGPLGGFLESLASQRVYGHTELSRLSSSQATVAPREVTAVIDACAGMRFGKVDPS